LDQARAGRTTDIFQQVWKQRIDLDAQHWVAPRGKLLHNSDGIDYDVRARRAKRVFDRTDIVHVDAGHGSYVSENGINIVDR
jgi:hypothetical protein